MLVGRTPHLHLRLEPLAICHADPLFAALHHDAVDTYLPSPDAPTLAAVRDRITRLACATPPPDEVWLNFAITTVIGRLEATRHPTWAEVAYRIGPHFQCRGFGTEAVRWLVDQLHDAGCDDIWACVHQHNAASIALVSKLGFQARTHSHRELSSFDEGDLMFEHARTSAP